MKNHKFELLVLATLLVALTTLLIDSTVQAGKRLPWRRRIGRDVLTLHLAAHRKTPPTLWPDEPATPEPIDPKRFERALGTLCGRMPPARREKYARLVLEEAAQFGIDPFELGALVYDQSRCWPRTPNRDKKRERYGLTRIPIDLHKHQFENRQYQYFVFNSEGELNQQALDFQRFPFNKWKASKVEANLYFAAGFLKIFHEQAPSLSQLFNSVPYRHPISHWFYGDRVRDVEPENRVLTARRRLIDYYNTPEPKPIGTFAGVPIHSPLDGVPRLVIDYFGNKRGNKYSYGHRGIDLDGSEGEPVRAIAAGRVSFAGTDLPGAQAHQQLTPEEAEELDIPQMGPGGFYVALNHPNQFGTIYMHLHTIAVKFGQEVVAGEIIGTLGRSGTKTSGPHLHLEFRRGTDRVDPADPLAPVLVNPFRKQ